MPTTDERVGYENEAVKRHRNKVKMKITAARMKYGGKILTGIRDGDFMVEKGGKATPLSSDENNKKHFAKDWKAQVITHAPDLVALLAGHVFDGSAEIDDDDGDDVQD